MIMHVYMILHLVGSVNGRFERIIRVSLTIIYYSRKLSLVINFDPSRKGNAIHRARSLLNPERHMPMKIEVFIPDNMKMYSSSIDEIWKAVLRRLKIARYDYR